MAIEIMGVGLQGPPGTEPYDVTSYGAIGDGVADDTVAIQAAIDASGFGGRVFFPVGEYKFSTLTVNKGQHLIGAGFHIDRDAVTTFGNAAYATDANFGGTVLRSTATSGVAITHLGGDHIQGGMQDFILIGPGSGTSIGIKIGSSSFAVLRAEYQNVMVCNFSKGCTMELNNECTFIDLAFRGCTIGLEFVANVISNSFYGLDCQWCPTGVNMLDATNFQDVFVGSIFQNCTTVGANLRGQCQTWISTYFETPTATAITFDLKALSWSVFVSLSSHANSTMEIRSGSNYNRLMGLQTTSQITLNNAGSGNILEGDMSYYTDTGTNTSVRNLTKSSGEYKSFTVRNELTTGTSYFIAEGGNAAGGEAGIKFQIQTGADKWSAYVPQSDLRLYFRDAVNARSHMYLIAGTTATLAYTVFQSSVTIWGDIDHNGTNVGFYNVAPVPRAGNPGVATGTDAAVINAVITALRNLGLVT